MRNIRVIARAAIAITVAMLVCACAGTSAKSSDDVPKKRCSVGAKLVCEERHGHVIRCSCKSDEDIRDILDPSVHE